MQRCMLDMLAEVQSELQRDRAAWPKAVPDGQLEGRSAALTAIEEGDLVDSPASGIEGGGGSVVPLGKLLRQAREDQLRRERQRLVDNLSSQGSQSQSAPSTSRDRGKAPRSARAPKPSTSQGFEAPSKKTAERPLVVHRHHHHHYHHHYVLGPDYEPDCSSSLHEDLEAAEASANRADFFKAPARLPGRRLDLQHLHYHHHTGEEGIPPRAHRLLHDARLAMSKDGGTARRPGAAAAEAASGVDTRLPRLA